MGDDTGFIDAFTSPNALAQAINEPTPVSASAVPSSQTDFNVAGQSADAKSVLTSGAAAVTSIVGAIGAISQAQANATFNAAAKAQAQSLGLQQLQTQGKVAALQNQTQLATAQAAYNRAAGIVTGSPGIMVILAVATLVIGGFALMKGRK